MSGTYILINLCLAALILTSNIHVVQCEASDATYWGEPERAPRDHDVYCASVRACCASVSARPAWERVKSGWLGMSAVWGLMSC